MATNDDLTSLGSWLVQNQHLQGTDDFNTVAQAFQQLDQQAQHTASQKAAYKGVGGYAKAYVPQVLPGMASGVGGLVDFFNQATGIGPAWRYGVQALTGHDIGMGDIGNYAADKTRDLTGAPKIEDLPESVRPYAYAGKATGEALSSMLAPEAALAGIAKGGATGMKMLDATAKSIADKGLVKNVVGAVPVAGMSGAGTMVADQLAPGSELGHAIGGTAGALVHPFGMARALGGRAGGLFEKLPGGEYVANKVRTALNPEAATAGNLGSMVESHVAALGGDVDQRLALIINDLENPLAQGPAHTRTLDPVVQDLAAHLGQKDVNVGRAFQEAADTAQGNMIANAQSQIGGDADKLFPAVQQRAQAGQQNVQSMLDRAKGAAVDAGNTLNVAPDVAANAGKQLDNMVNSGLTANKGVLDQIDQTIGNQSAMGPQAARVYLGQVQAGKYVLDPSTQSMLQRVAGNPNATVEDYRALYSQLRRDGRDFSAGQFGVRPNADIARSANQLADAFNGTFAFRSGSLPGLKNLPAQQEASRAMYDRFSRSPAAPLVSDLRSGAGAVPEALAAQRTLTGEELAQGQKIRGVLDATGAPPETPLTPASSGWGTVTPDVKAAEAPFAHTALETGQRYQVGKQVLDPATGMADPKAVSRALQNEPAVYQQFPGLTQDMQSAARASQAADRAGQRAQQFHDMLKADKSGVGRVLARAETPEGLITEALGKKNPEAYLDSLYAAARRAGPDGLEGLKGVVNKYIGTGENAVDRATNILRPVNDKGNVADWMLKKGLIDKDQHAIITGEAKHVTANADAFVRAKAAAVDPTSKTPDYVDIASRIFGASAGNKLSGLMGGHTLISAQVGSKYARKLAGSMGLPSQINMLNYGIENPQKLADMFKQAQQQRVSRGLAPPPARGRPSDPEAFNMGLWPLLAVKSEQAGRGKRRPAGLLD